jgi:hypothetical protein
LYEIYTDIRINMELYKTFSFALIPFLILFLLGSTFYNNPKTTELLNGNLETKVLVIVMTIVIFCILFMAIAAEWWVHKFYGKYAKEIRKVLDELKE